jgi:hypothetical protein
VSSIVLVFFKSPLTAVSKSSKTFSVKFNYGNPLDLNINTPIEYSNIIHNAYIDAYCAGINYDNLFNPEDYIDNIISIP